MICPKCGVDTATDECSGCGVIISKFLNSQKRNSIGENEDIKRASENDKLLKCDICGGIVSPNADMCPHCGDPKRISETKKTSSQSSKSKKGGVVLLIFLLFIWFVIHSVNNQSSNNTSKDQKAATPSKIIPLPPVLTWEYNEFEHKIDGSTVKIASVKSLNEFQFEFPYTGTQRATLMLRKNVSLGEAVLLTIEKGQFLCGINDCMIKVRFDEGEVYGFSASEPTDHSTTMLILSSNSYDRFIPKLKAAKKIYVEANFYQEGLRVFEFDVSGLQW